MQSWFTFELDGEICRVESEAANQTLARFLSELDPFYSRYSEGNSWQGGSPVIMAEDIGVAPRFRSVDAHLILLPMIADQMIWTPEGISDLAPDHPVVRSLEVDHIECGEARRQSVLTLFFEGYYRPDMRRIGQLSEQFDSLVSRTADVASIRDSGIQLFAAAENRRHEASQRSARSGQENEVWTGKKDIFKDRFTKALFLKKPTEELDFVDRDKRRFHRPQTVADLQRLIAQNPEAQFIAGGTGLMQDGSEFDYRNLISLENISELQLIRGGQDFWEIGAAVNLTRIGETIGSEYASFLKALTRFGSRPVRNRATLGGYLAMASDSGQLAPLLVAMDARIQLTSLDGDRNAPVSHFYEGGGKTIIRPGEFIRSILIPRSNESALSNRGMTSRITDIYTVGPRRCLCEPFVTGAFGLELREQTVAKAWIAYTGVADRPIRARNAEAAIAGKVWNETTMTAALTPLYQEVTVSKPDVGRANVDYRKQLVMTLFQKFFSQHPTAYSIRPEEQGVTRDFSLHNQPFFDAVR